MLICVVFLLFHVENFAVFISSLLVVLFFRGSAPGVNDTLTEKTYRNDESGERAKKAAELRT